MRIYVQVKPRSAKNEIQKISDGEYKIRVTAVPEKGKANTAIIKLLADYFSVPKSSIEIVGGKTARTKIVDIRKNNSHENGQR